MSAWLKLDPDRLEGHGKTLPSNGGVRIEMRMSPYDIPDAVRGDYDQSIERFVIEFRYIGDEPWRRQIFNSQITARIGKHSGRLYGLEIDVKSLKAESVEVALSAANEGIDHLASQSHSDGILSDRYRVAKDAIHEASELLPEAFRQITPSKRPVSR